MSHVLTIRPARGVRDDAFAKTSDLEVLLDGKPLDGVERIEIMPLDAIGGLIQVNLSMCINPDFELPSDITASVATVSPEDEELASRLVLQANAAGDHPIRRILFEAAVRLRRATFVSS